MVPRVLALALATAAALPAPWASPSPSPTPEPATKLVNGNATDPLASSITQHTLRRNAEELSSLTVLSINFACRDVAHLSCCDNCQKRFDLIASAIRGEPGFSGLPDLGSVDAIVMQELGTAEENFAQITAALATRGFTHTTGAPGPTTDDPKCANPPGPLYAKPLIEVASALSGLESGGLVTFSRHPILRSSAYNWCAHNLPAPAGYLSTLLDVDGVATLVLNVHLFPEFDFGIDAKEVRTYQFSELRGYVDKAAAALREAGGPYAVVLGGDFNEDAYGLSIDKPGSHCEAITDTAYFNFAALNLNLHAACASGAIGAPTWDPTNNDLAALFSKDSAKHEVLDYLFAFATSAPAAPHGPVNTVAPLIAQNGWTGEFCHSPITGTLDPRGTFERTVRALTDHNSVTATLALPAPPADRGAAAAAARAALAAMEGSWRAEMQQAACGQSGALCAFDSNCCDAEYSWTNNELTCDGTRCKACKPLGASCSWGFEGSECCGYDDYSATNGVPNGLHCEWRTCARKFTAGAHCWHDEECASRDCRWGRCRG